MTENQNASKNENNDSQETEKKLIDYIIEPLSMLSVDTLTLGLA